MFARSYKRGISLKDHRPNDELKSILSSLQVCMALLNDVDVFNHFAFYFHSYAQFTLATPTRLNSAVAEA